MMITGESWGCIFHIWKGLMFINQDHTSVNSYQKRPHMVSMTTQPHLEQHPFWQHRGSTLNVITQSRGLLVSTGQWRTALYRSKNRSKPSSMPITPLNKYTTRTRTDAQWKIEKCIYLLAATAWLLKTPFYTKSAYIFSYANSHYA